MVGASLVGKEEGGEGGGHGGSLFDQLIYLLLLISALQFEVHKREGLGTDLGNILSITIPRELRGRSEVVVFISDKPVRGKVRMLQGVGRDWHSFIIVLNEFLLQTFPPPPSLPRRSRLAECNSKATAVGKPTAEDTPSVGGEVSSCTKYPIQPRAVLSGTFGLRKEGCLPLRREGCLPLRKEGCLPSPNTHSLQLVREAREQKTCLQLEILTNRVNIPVEMMEGIL